MIHGDMVAAQVPARNSANAPKSELQSQEKPDRSLKRFKDLKNDDGRGMRLDRMVREAGDKPEEKSKPADKPESDKSNSDKPDPEKSDSKKNPNTSAVREAPPTPLSDAESMGQLLQLSDVIASTYRAFPLLEIARLQSRVTSGQQISAMGAYDVKLEYYSLNQPVGFYETYRNGIGVARQLWWGGYASAGYRIGRGNYEPWYKERETNGSGEFKVGLVQPLLQGRAIDPFRVELFQSGLRR
ncbi:MAG TPA: hypothetical protein VM260_06310, partial [Pirellula sp.]|nr:hypothetical protein [Pirellula sp.]